MAALAWTVKVGTNWNPVVEISSAEFQNGNPNDRWVAEIFSFDARGGTAIIKVAEDCPSADRHSSVVYSWRKWDLRQNKEIQILRICKDPFEPFDHKRIKLVRP